MLALTVGGFMCTLSFPPTSSRIVAPNRVWVFKTCGGCFSIINVLKSEISSEQAKSKKLIKLDCLPHVSVSIHLPFKRKQLAEQINFIPKYCSH